MDLVDFSLRSNNTTVVTAADTVVVTVAVADADAR